jgi:hypothetical protein
VYENVVSIRLKGAEFPIFNTTNVYKYQKNPSGGGPPAGIAITGVPMYFFINMEGLNKCDETAPKADRSTFTDHVFAKIQIPDSTNRIIYSEDSGPTNISVYYPPIGKLDRFSIQLRTHLQHDSSNQLVDNGSYIYWNTGGDHGLTFEIEMLDNAFNAASSFETRMPNDVGFGQGC